MLSINKILEQRNACEEGSPRWITISSVIMELEVVFKGMDGVKARPSIEISKQLRGILSSAIEALREATRRGEQVVYEDKIAYLKGLFPKEVDIAVIEERVTEIALDLRTAEPEDRSVHKVLGLIKNEFGKESCTPEVRSLIEVALD